MNTQHDFQSEALANSISLENAEGNLFNTQNELRAYQTTVENLESSPGIALSPTPSAWIGYHTSYPGECVLFKTEYEAQDWARQYKKEFVSVKPLFEQLAPDTNPEYLRNFNDFLSNLEAMRDTKEDSGV